MRDKLKNIGLIVLGALLLAAITFGAFTFWQKQRIISAGEEARVNAQNRIAQLSATVQENENIWSRLAQEKEIEMAELREVNEELADLIESKNQEITTLTTVIARLRNVRVVVDSGNVTETTEPVEEGEGERYRVEFDQTWRDFMRIHGFTLTNPAEAEISVDYTRPARISVVTVQQEDLSWSTYIETDIPNLEIGEIDSIVNPISRPQEETPWFHNIMFGIGGSVGVQGQMGTAHLYFGYDAGDWDLGITAGGIFTANGVDFAPGLQFTFAPFAL